MNAARDQMPEELQAALAASLYVQRRVIRPAYLGDVFAGFAIHVWNAHTMKYEAVGKVFSQYKHAMLALQAIEGNPEHRRVTGIRNGVVGGILTWVAVIGICMLILGLLGGCASSDNWTRADTVRELTFQVANAADAYQTSKYRADPTIEEGMPITRAFIGANPTGRDVAMYFGTLAVSHYFISRALPPSWRKWYQGATIGVTVATVADNCANHKQLCK